MPQSESFSNIFYEPMSSCISRQITDSAEERLYNIAVSLNYADVLIGYLVNHPNISDEVVALLMCLSAQLERPRMIAEGVRIDQ